MWVLENPLGLGGTWFIDFTFFKFFSWVCKLVVDSSSERPIFRWCAFVRKWYSLESPNRFYSRLKPAKVNEKIVQFLTFWSCSSAFSAAFREGCSIRFPVQMKKHIAIFCRLRALRWSCWNPGLHLCGAFSANQHRTASGWPYIITTCATAPSFFLPLPESPGVLRRIRPPLLPSRYSCWNNQFSAICPWSIVSYWLFVAHEVISQ